MVQVLSVTGEPLAHATVSFLLPASGASGTFGDRGLSVTVETDERGMATARGLTPNGVEGVFRIRVTASWRGEAANVSIAQTNAEPAAKSSRSKWIIAAAVVGGAAAGGIAAASHGGKGSGTAGGSTGSAAPSGTTIVPGSPSFGPPH